MDQQPAHEPGSLFAIKSISDLGDRSDRLKRSLGPFSLIALGIGAIIGAGLFSLTGIAAAENAGPAVVISFIVAGVGCAFAGLCYSELASMIPVSGSAYTYAYATMGELVAWIIGWDLVLEYAVGAATVSVSWSKYVVSLLGEWGLALPAALTMSPFDTAADAQGIVNLPAIFIIVLISLLLIRGTQESALVNNIMVAVKLAIVAAVIGFGAFYINHQNYVPFVPPNDGTFGHYGLSGIMRGAGTIFFAYIGFDAVSTAAQEARKPQRDMPIGILGSLLICTVLYVMFGLVLTGVVNYHDMIGDAAPVATAINKTPFTWLQVLVKLGIICGFTTVMLVLLMGQSRIFYTMSKDGLLPKLFSRVHETRKTPWVTNLVFMVFASLLGGFLPISQLGHMTSIGTLLAFIIVCAGVVVLRRTEPDAERGFRTPWVPVVPALGILVCLAMMVSLDILSWARLGVWLAIGLAIFFAYGRRHSRATAAG